MEQYIQFARKALNIVGADYSRGDDLKSLTSKLKNIMAIPITQTEFNMQQLCLEIAKIIESQDNDDKITALLDKLESESTFNLFD